MEKSWFAPQWLRLDIILFLVCFYWPALVLSGTVVYVKRTGETSTQVQQPQQQQNQLQTDQSERDNKSPPDCMYSFVVNEMDSSKCPTLLHSTEPPMQNEEPTGRKSNSALDFDMLNKRIEMLEERLSQEMRDNANLKSTLEEHTKQLRTAERTLSTQNVNLTNLVLNMHDLKHKLNKQKNVWKNIDNKLSGVMLDIAEVYNKIDALEKPSVSLKDKTIPVVAVSDNVHCPNIPPNATKYIDCGRIYDTGIRESGVYYITPLYTNCPIPVYCDMDTPPGGWTVLLHREDGSLNFHRGWEAYRKGFGDVTYEHWLGNDNIFLLSNQGYYELRVDLYDFFGSRVYAEYETFKIDGERDNYRLHLGNYTGTAPDGFSSHDGVEFSTPDRDHDYWPDYHCAREWTSGWWFNNCWFVFLTGPYYNTTDVKYRGISWNDWKQEQLKHVEMKIRPYA